LIKGTVIEHTKMRVDTTLFLMLCFR